eukprot:745555-Rhodomonas_salina.2
MRFCGVALRQFCWSPASKGGGRRGEAHSVVDLACRVQNRAARPLAIDWLVRKRRGGIRDLLENRERIRTSEPSSARRRAVQWQRKSRIITQRDKPRQACVTQQRPRAGSMSA